MTSQNRTTLYTYFQTGDKPTQSQFADLIDSSINLSTTSAQSVQGDVSALQKLDVTGGFTVKASSLSDLTGNVTVGGDIVIAGSATINNEITIAASSNANLTGNVQVGGKLSVSGNSTLTGNLTVTGTTTLNGVVVFTSATVATQAAGDSSTNIANTLFVNPNSSIAAVGFRKEPDGLLIQWGSYTGNGTAGNPTAVTFPLNFTANVYAITMSVGSNSTSSQTAWYDTITVSGFNGHSSVNSGIVGWIALGK